MEALKLSLIEEGGLMMWPLLGLSVVGFVFFIERTLYLHKGQIRTRDFLSGIKNLLHRRRLVEALTHCEETPGPVGGVVKAALLNYDKPDAEMLGAVRSAGLVEIPNLERRIGTIGAIALVAPLVGLFGTVEGLQEAFVSMQNRQANADLGLMAAGFSRALITTLTGLGIAIMAHLAQHFLHGRVRALVHDMEWAANDIMQFLTCGLPEEPGADPSAEGAGAGAPVAAGVSHGAVPPAGPSPRPA